MNLLKWFAISIVMHGGLLATDVLCVEDEELGTYVTVFENEKAESPVGVVVPSLLKGAGHSWQSYEKDSFFGGHKHVRRPESLDFDRLEFHDLPVLCPDVQYLIYEGNLYYPRGNLLPVEGTRPIDERRLPALISEFDRLPKLKYIKFSECIIGEDVFRRICGFRNIEHISFEDCEVFGRKIASMQLHLVVPSEADGK